MVPLQSVIDVFFNHHCVVPKWHYVLMGSWNDIVGLLSDKMQLKKIEGSMLCIGVYDSHWMHELYMLKPTIIHAINKALAGNYVLAIKFIFSKRDNTIINTGIMALNGVKKECSSSIKELGDIHKAALCKVQDPSLREYLQLLYHKCEGA